MGQGINQEDSKNIENSFRRANFFHRLFSLPQLVFNFIFDCCFYGPGVGKVGTEKIIKHKVGKVSSSVGDIRLPILKMPCFDLNFGFFNDRDDLNDGLYDIEELKEKQVNTLTIESICGAFLGDHMTLLATFESYWILNYRRPKDVFGDKEVTCFIENQLDGLIYIYHIKENQLIDYEKIVSDYESEVDNLNFMEKMEREAVRVECPESFCDNECRKRIKLDEQTCCVSDFCFNENSTTVRKSEDL